MRPATTRLAYFASLVAVVLLGTTKSTITSLYENHHVCCSDNYNSSVHGDNFAHPYFLIVKGGGCLCVESCQGNKNNIPSSMAWFVDADYFKSQIEKLCVPCYVDTQSGPSYFVLMKTNASPWIVLMASITGLFPPFFVVAESGWHLSIIGSVCARVNYQQSEDLRFRCFSTIWALMHLCKYDDTVVYALTNMK